MPPNAMADSQHRADDSQDKYPVPQQRQGGRVGENAGKNKNQRGRDRAGRKAKEAQQTGATRRMDRDTREPKESREPREREERREVDESREADLSRREEERRREERHQGGSDMRSEEGDDIKGSGTKEVTPQEDKDKSERTKEKEGSAGEDGRKEEEAKREGKKWGVEDLIKSEEKDIRKDLGYLPPIARKVKPQVEPPAMGTTTRKPTVPFIPVARKKEVPIPVAEQVPKSTELPANNSEQFRTRRLSKEPQETTASKTAYTLRARGLVTRDDQSIRSRPPPRRKTRIDLSSRRSNSVDTLGRTNSAGVTLPAQYSAALLLPDDCESPHEGTDVEPKRQASVTSRKHEGKPMSSLERKHPSRASGRRPSLTKRRVQGSSRPVDNETDMPTKRGAKRRPRRRRDETKSEENIEADGQAVEQNDILPQNVRTHDMRAHDVQTHDVPTHKVEEQEATNGIGRRSDDSNDLSTQIPPMKMEENIHSTNHENSTKQTLSEQHEKNERHPTSEHQGATEHRGATEQREAVEQQEALEQQEAVEQRDASEKRKGFESREGTETPKGAEPNKVPEPCKEAEPRRETESRKEAEPREEAGQAESKEAEHADSLQEDEDGRHKCDETTLSEGSTRESLQFKPSPSRAESTSLDAEPAFKVERLRSILPDQVTAPVQMEPPAAPIDQQVRSRQESSCREKTSREAPSGEAPSRDVPTRQDPRALQTSIPRTQSRANKPASDTPAASALTESASHPRTRPLEELLKGEIPMKKRTTRPVKKNDRAPSRRESRAPSDLSRATSVDTTVEWRRRRGVTSPRHESRNTETAVGSATVTGGRSSTAEYNTPKGSASSIEIPERGWPEARAPSVERNARESATVPIKTEDLVMPEAQKEEISQTEAKAVGQKPVGQETAEEKALGQKAAGQKALKSTDSESGELKDEGSEAESGELQTSVSDEEELKVETSSRKRSLSSSGLDCAEGPKKRSRGSRSESKTAYHTENVNLFSPEGLDAPLLMSPDSAHPHTYRWFDDQAQTPRSENIKAPRTKTETARIETARIKTTRTETSRTETSRTETSRTEAFTAETVKTESARRELARVETPMKAESTPRSSRDRTSLDRQSSGRQSSGRQSSGRQSSGRQSLDHRRESSPVSATSSVAGSNAEPKSSHRGSGKALPQPSTPKLKDDPEISPVGSRCEITAFTERAVELQSLEEMADKDQELKISRRATQRQAHDEVKPVIEQSERASGSASTVELPPLKAEEHRLPVIAEEVLVDSSKMVVPSCIVRTPVTEGTEETVAGDDVQKPIVSRQTKSSGKSPSTRQPNNETTRTEATERRHSQARGVGKKVLETKGLDTSKAASPRPVTRVKEIASARRAAVRASVELSSAGARNVKKEAKYATRAEMHKARRRVSEPGHVSERDIEPQNEFKRVTRAQEFVNTRKKRRRQPADEEGGGEGPLLYVETKLSPHVSPLSSPRLDEYPRAPPEIELDADAEDYLFDEPLHSVGPTPPPASAPAASSPSSPRADTSSTPTSAAPVTRKRRRSAIVVSLDRTSLLASIVCPNANFETLLFNWAATRKVCTCRVIPPCPS